MEGRPTVNVARSSWGRSQKVAPEVEGNMSCRTNREHFPEQGDGRKLTAEVVVGIVLEDGRRMACV